jgi:hypothetical protein
MNPQRDRQSVRRVSEDAGQPKRNVQSSAGRFAGRTFIMRQAANKISRLYHANDGVSRGRDRRREVQPVPIV